MIATEQTLDTSGTDSLLPTSDPFADWYGDTGWRRETGDSVAHGVAVRSEIAANDCDSLWRVLVEHRLLTRLAGPLAGECFADVLAQWEEHLSALVPRSDWEQAAVVPRPSRDPAGSAELLRHGFAPVRVLAVRPADRLAAPGPATQPGVRIRPAEPADLDTAVALSLRLQRYDAQFGLATPRPNAEGLLREALSEELRRGEPTAWLAELYGRPLGLLRIQFPPGTAWISPFVAVDRMGYVASLHVDEAARSSGVGSALAAHAHQLFDEAGMEAALLHHALPNPTSTPFWYAQGYRPLWTYWYRRPAVR
ncbi:GNAT family N-acetyltransferase [Amycolatopsis rhizosphaerae]|uniref:GNAT family N-acetyltransferase n=1 Tax=Amycolatopsis rhizosphaerae TaxID=2053003 RepID=UPI001FEB88FD|nr:GNAT family N-acetyltransferase [Amycolatopsis rhizosphaerae]